VPEMRAVKPQRVHTVSSDTSLHDTTDENPRRVFQAIRMASQRRIDKAARGGRTARRF
jgi:hypothetical protein